MMLQDRKCLRHRKEDGVRGKKNMEITEVKNHIKTGQYDKFYIFCGEEHAVMKIYLKMMAKDKERSH